MDKYIECLYDMSQDMLHVAQSYAIDNKSPFIEPAHLLKSLLHKNMGLVSFIEDTLGEDYYYILDWCDIRVKQCGRSPYPMKDAALSQSSKAVVKQAMELSATYGRETTIIDIFAALASPGVGFSYEQLKTLPLTPEKILGAVSSENPSKQTTLSGRPVQTGFSTDTEYCSRMDGGKRDWKIVGYDDEIRSMFEILARKDRANIAIVGETGVGKSSLIDLLVEKTQTGEIPSSLSNLSFYALDLISISQGVSYKGEIEDRFKKVTESLCKESQPVLVIENFHTLEDKQAILSGMLPVVKKMLSQNVVQIICTATVDGFTKDMEKDYELMGFFEKMSVEEPSPEMTAEILRSKKSSYENYHHLKVEDEAVEEIVRLARRYMSEKRLPSSALDLLDRAMASTKVSIEINGLGKDAAEEVNVLKKEAIQDIVSRMTGIPMGNLQSEERQKLENAEELLHKRVIGQNHAVRSVLEAIYESRSGLNKKGQPMGSFFFLGPTGTGKTELAKSLANFLFNDENSILRFDMSEYKEEHSVALLYGAPPGYVGYEEGGLLVNQIRQHPYSVVLFDEIEKAHKSVFDLFLQILDEGKLHDRLGRVGDFSNALIIFTSNIGSEYIFQSFEQGIVPTHDKMLEVMQGHFRPEFLARLTEIIPFSPITEEMIGKIFDIHIKNLLKMLAEKDIELSIDDTARNYITSVGFNAHYGARPILGIIRKEIRRPLSKLIISGTLAPGDKVLMLYNAEKKEITWEISNDD